MNANLLLLTLCQGLFLTNNVTFIAINGLVGLSMAPLVVLSGPEGGLSPAEEALALSSGFVPVTLGSRVLRAETAPLAVLAALSV